MPHRKEFSVPIIAELTSKPDLEKIVQWIPNKELVAQHIDRFRPWEQWRISGGDNGKYTITDSFLPPSQTGDAPMLDGNKLPGGCMTTTMEARVPASALFGIGRQLLRGDESLGNARYGACGLFSVAEFNNSGYSGAVWEDSPIAKVTGEWRKRMGIKSDHQYSRPNLILDNGVSIMFEASYNSGWSRPYGAFNTEELAEIGYGMVMLGNYLPKVNMTKGDYFFANIQIGQRGANRLVAVEAGDWTAKNKTIKCHLMGNSFSPLMKEALSKKYPTVASYIPDELPLWLARSEALDVLTYACGWDKRGQSIDPRANAVDKEIDQAKAIEQATVIMQDMVSFTVNTPDHRESIARYYDKQ